MKNGNFRFCNGDIRFSSRICDIARHCLQLTRPGVNCFTSSVLGDRPGAIRDQEVEGSNPFTPTARKGR